MANDLGLVIETFNSAIGDRHIEVGEDIILVPLEQESKVLNRLLACWISWATEYAYRINPLNKLLEEMVKLT